MTVVTVSPEAGTDVDTAAPDADPGAGVTETRHARALAALRSAEVRTGVRKQATATTAGRAARAVQTVRVEPARAQVRSLPGGRANGPAAAPVSTPTSASASAESVVRVAPPAGSSTSTARASTGRAGSPDPGQGARVLPVHPRLADLLPDGGLRTGTTVVVRGSTSLLLTLLAEASRDGAWTVLVGYPAAGMAAAADAGCDLARTLVVPLPAGSGVDAPAVLAALIDGMDVVVIGPEVALLDQDRRRLTARARERGTVLVAAGPAPVSGVRPSVRGARGTRETRGARQDGGSTGWAGAHVVLEATAGDWTGIDQGAGWLRRRTLRVRRTGRGNASRPLDVDVEVPVCRAVGAAERAGEERSAVREGAETVVPGGDVVRRHGSESRLGLVG